MDRSEFIKNLWKRAIQPFLLVLVAFFCIKFLINVFNENGTERLVTILVLGIVVLFTLSYLIGLLFRATVSKINAKLPKRVRFWLRIIGQIINYITPIILGIIFYHFWMKDWITASIIIGFIMIQKIIEIIKKEKQATKQA